ncbi:MAG: hypothetical protein WBN75_17665 [Verrucomicrobiia bacterium]
MKMASRFLVFAFFGLCASIGFTLSVHAGWQQVRMAVSVSVVTTNGITSAEYKWNQGGCENLDSTGPLIRKGSHFSYNFDLEVETGVACPQYVIAEHSTVVLGTLAPGTYTLTTTSWGVPVATTTFTVPTNSGRQPYNRR